MDERPQCLLEKVRMVRAAREREVHRPGYSGARSIRHDDPHSVSSIIRGQQHLLDQAKSRAIADNEDDAGKGSGVQLPIANSATAGNKASCVQGSLSRKRALGL